MGRTIITANIMTDVRNCINKIIRRTRGFTQIDNDLLRDERLSFKARGILAMVLSNKDSWLTTSAWIEGKGQEGREAIKSGLAELEKHGYLVRTIARNSGGKIIGHGMEWHECPQRDQMTASRIMVPENQMTGTRLPAAKNTIQTEKQKEEKNTKPMNRHEWELDFEAARAIQLDITASEALRAKWAEYQGYRKDRHHSAGKMKLAWTERAARMAAEGVNIAALKHGEQIVIDRIRAAIAGQWQGLNFDSIDQPSPSPSRHAHKKPPTPRNATAAPGGSLNDTAWTGDV